MPVSRISLPIDAILPEIAASLRRHPSVIITAEPGAGKTTRVAPLLLEEPDLIGSDKVLLIEPRRVVARATASRIAQERGGRPGDEVGYQVRFDNRTSAKTRLVVMTPGILLRWLTDDAFLDGVSAVVLDEFHERSLELDLALGMLLRLQRELRPELRLVVMSATLQTETLSRYLDPASDHGCPTITAKGRTFPVEIRYMPRPADERIAQRPLAVLDDLWQRTSGDVLVFLPGAGEIRQAMSLADGWSRDVGAELIPLYGDLSPEEQDRALRPAESRRRVIFATNIAETSLTLPNVTAVIDTGLSRQLRMCGETGLNALEIEPISQASADQRTGRAGRVSAGVCVRLWSEASQRARPAHTTPEVQRADLTPATLQLFAWGERSLDNFPWFEKPQPHSLQYALRTLRLLEAIDNEGLTPVGRQMIGIPAHPRLARALVEASRKNVVPAVAMAAAVMSERLVLNDAGPRSRNTARRIADIVEDIHTDRLSLSTPGLFAVTKAASQIVRMIDKDEGPQRSVTDNPEAFARSLLAGFPDRVCCRREAQPSRARMTGGRAVLCEIARPEPRDLFLALDVENATAEGVVRLYEPLLRDWLPASSLSTGLDLSYNEAADRVQARRQVVYDDLVLEESPAPFEVSEQSANVLAEACHTRWAQAFPATDEALQNVIARSRFVATHAPDAGLPVMDETWLKEFLPNLCWGLRSVAEVKAASWKETVFHQLTADQQRLLDRLAPEKIRVPSGSELCIDYTGERPVLAVRIQEIFGWTSTPRIAGERIPLLLHLLAPNHRPQQVTDDLTSFWKTAYPIIRGELRRRYPRHSWPDDPLSATPQKKPAPRS